MATKKKANKKADPNAAPKPPAVKKPQLYRVSINEYDRDPVFMVMATTAAEAAQKALAQFVIDFPKETLEDLSVSDPEKATFIP